MLNVFHEYVKSLSIKILIRNGEVRSFGCLYCKMNAICVVKVSCKLRPGGVGGEATPRMPNATPFFGVKVRIPVYAKLRPGGGGFAGNSFATTI